MTNPLRKDLQELVSADILTPDIADRIEKYYQNKDGLPNKKFNIVLGILGALLVGSGIILLIAHNWDEMSRITRTGFAFLPLAAGQALCIFTLLKRRHDLVWRESSSVILFFGVASCMALVSQIYHITGTLAEFLLNWLFMTAPLIYIMRSSLVSLLVIACATWYAILEGYQGSFAGRDAGAPYFYLVFLAFIIPHYYRYFQFNRNSNFFHLHNWLLVCSTIIALGTFATKSEDLYQWIFIGYCSLVGGYYLLGNSTYFNGQRLLANPFLVAGVIGPIIIFLIWSYDSLWSPLLKSGDSSFREMFNSAFFYISVALLAIHAYLLIKSATQGNALFDPLRLSPYVFALSILFFARAPFLGLLITNAWILVIAIFYIRTGAGKDHFGILNFGLSIIALLALLRFFDDSIGFVWRGLFFVTTGVGFVAANYWLLRKRKSVS